MKIHHEPTTPTTFYAVASFAEKDALKAARWRWHPTAKRWWTQDPNAAQRLAIYADAATAALLGRPGAPQINAVDAVAASRATAPLAPLAIPTPPGRELMPFQAAGVARLEQIHQTGLRGAILADEMGLGKTPQAIAILNLHPEFESILILCRASLRLNWRNELAAWSTIDRTVGIAETTHAPTTQIVIAHYDIFSRKSPAAAALQARKWSIMVCDEAHDLSNPDANRTAAILGRKATKRTAAVAGIDATRVLFLTGTPMRSRPINLYTQLAACDPAAWPSWYSYAVTYCAGFKSRWGFDSSGSSNAQELNARLRSTVMVRRLKSDPGIMDDLPAKRDQLIPLPANGAASILAAERPYLAKIQALAANLDAIDPATNAAEFAAATRALSSQLADFSELSKIRKALEVAKVDTVLEYSKLILESEQKLVIFGHHIEALEAVTMGLADYGAAVAHGSTPTDERQRLVELFQDPNSPCRVLVCSLTAMGVGHTMHAAAHVLHMAMSWLPSDMSQATDRLHRIGQKRQVTAHYLMYDDSLEIYMARTVLKKIKILNATLDADTGTAAADHQADAAAREAAIRAQIAALAAQPEPAAAPAAQAQPAPQPAADAIPPARVAAITAALRYLAGDDLDHATLENGVGFNKFDGKFGHTLATQSYPLTQRQAAAAFKMLTKYRGQLGAMLDACQ